MKNVIRKPKPKSKLKTVIEKVIPKHLKIKRDLEKNKQY